MSSIYANKQQKNCRHKSFNYRLPLLCTEHKIYLSFTLGRTPFLSHNYFFLDVSWLKLRFLWKRLYTYETFEAFFLVIYLSVRTKKSFRLLIKHINSFLPLFSLITCVLCASFNYFRCFLWNFFGNFRWFWRHFIS